VPSSLTHANYKAQGGSAAGPSDGARSGATAELCGAEAVRAFDASVSLGALPTEAR